MPTLTHNTVILTIPIYRDEDADLLNYSTEDDRVLPGDCYGPLVAAGRPVIADVVIRVGTTTDNDVSVDGCTFTNRDVLSIHYRIPTNHLILEAYDKCDNAGAKEILLRAANLCEPKTVELSKKITSDLAEFFRYEIARAGL